MAFSNSVRDDEVHTSIWVIGLAGSALAMVERRINPIKEGFAGAVNGVFLQAYLAREAWRVVTEHSISR